MKQRSRTEIEMEKRKRFLFYWPKFCTSINDDAAALSAVTSFALIALRVSADDHLPRSPKNCTVQSPKKGLVRGLVKFIPAVP